MDDVVAFKAEVDAYLRASGIKPSTFGQYAVGDHQFLDRLSNHVERMNRRIASARAWMKAHPPKGGARHRPKARAA